MTPALLLLLAGLVMPPSPTFDPRRGWYTLETEHFSVHFSCRGRLAAESQVIGRVEKRRIRP